MVHDIRGRLVGADLLVKLKQIELPSVDLAQAKQMARAAARSVDDGDLSYAIIIVGRSLVKGRMESSKIAAREAPHSAEQKTNHINVTL